MCGGAPKPQAPKKEAPPPAPPPELILSKEEQGVANVKKGKKQKRAGRSALVTPGLSLGSAVAKNAASGAGLRAPASTSRSKKV
jgi:hypothetical protein